MIKKFIFILLFINNISIAQTMNLDCVDTILFEGIYRHQAVTIDYANNAISIEGWPATNVLIGENTILFNAVNYNHKISRVTGVMEVRKINPRDEYTFVFNCL